MQKVIYKKVLIEEDAHKSLKVLAAMQGVTMSEVVRRLVKLNSK